MHACVRAYMYVCMCTCMHACMHSCMHVCVCMYVCNVCMYVCMHACMYVRTYIHTYIHTYTRVEMHACFGFSLARLRRARTIDLQCQSLSLRRAFLLRSVCLSLHLTVESFAVRWPTRSQNRSTITVKIDRRSIPGDTSGHPKSSENRSRDPLQTPRGVQECPEGISGASRERPGASRERPGSVFE